MRYLKKLRYYIKVFGEARKLSYIYDVNNDKIRVMIRSKKPQSEIVIDLTGPDGNAFALLAYAKRYAQQLDLDFNQIKDEMTSGDYENLVQVFDNYFGEFIILER
jgi:hypothetical protein